MTFKIPISPTVLIVLDGFGIRKERKANAILMSQTPCLDRLQKEYPTTQLQASGLAVGLPQGQMGNSEVGHLNLGAGRVVHQDITRISKSISDGTFFSNPEFISVLNVAKKSRLHLLGLLSDGGVHSSLDHLAGLLKAAAQQGVKQVLIHALTDGRDTSPKSALRYLQQFRTLFTQYNIGEIASVCGRFYGMDRDHRWERIARAYALLTQDGENIFHANSAEEAITQAYVRGESDEFIQPTLVTSSIQPTTLKDGDAIIFFNFRSDRMREIVRAITDGNFNEFQRTRSARLGAVLSLTQYDKNFTFPVMFPPQSLNHILGEVLSDKGYKQLRIAETEKYAHVTYFFNGGVERPFVGEDRILVPSPRDVTTYDQKPSMALPEVVSTCVEKINTGEYTFILVNFANPDMLGHTGSLQAAIAAIEEVDRGISKIVTATLGQNGRVLITADHGNCEMMMDEATGQPHTAHTTNPVPLILVDPKNNKSLAEGALCDVAPTILQLMNLPQPIEMTGHSLLCEAKRN